jgi:hypothetical protein
MPTDLRDGRLGHFVASIPVPHDPEATELIRAGAVTVGVEHRIFDPAVEAAKLGAAAITAAGPDSLFASGTVDQGVCLHVFAGAGTTEHLRFDCFDDEPHYHYIVPNGPGTGNMLVHHDAAANGPMLAWALNVLRTRLPDLLRLADADDLADAVESSDSGELASAMERVEQLARRSPASLD